MSWTSGGQPDGMTLALGPMTVAGPESERLSEVVSKTVSLLKDLALPLAVALAGWFFQMAQVDQQRAQQTWNLILPRCQESAERFYMPMWTVIAGLLRKHQLGAERDVRSMFTSYVLLLCHTAALFKERGLFQLKDRQGEEVIADFAGAYLQFGRSLGLREYWHIVGSVDRYSVLPDIEARLEGWNEEDIALQGYYRAFEESIDGEDFATLLIVLKAFSVVLVYETNVIYHQWYEKPERFPFDELMDLLLRLEAANGLGERQDRLRKSLADYLRSHRSARYLWRRNVLRGWAKRAGG